MIAAGLPILMQRCPYGFDLAKVRRSFDAEYKELAEAGFIFILQDIRGRFGEADVQSDADGGRSSHSSRCRALYWS